MGTKTWLLLVAALAILSLGVAGCGGDDDDGDAAGGDTGAATDDGGQPAAEQVLRLVWGAEPPSLDPGLATDTTSSNVILALMDPLVKLNPDTLEAEPSLAESWEVDGPVITFTLRQDGAWTNGDPVTAADFEYSWKRTLDPALAADYAYQLYGIKGAAEYNGCAPPNSAKCDRLRDEVAVRAVDDYTLEVELTSEQPWFIQQVSHHSFLPVHQGTVDQFGADWTEPGNIVTNGAFMLEGWEHEATITLVKNPDWRDADSVSLERIEGRIIVDGTTRVQAFEAGEVDALDGGGLPPEEIERLKGEEYYEQYPALGTYYYGFNTKNISLEQRRALSLAINRQIITDDIDRTGRDQSTGFTPAGMPGFEEINPESPWLPAQGDLEQAQELLGQVDNADMQINLFHNDAPGHKEIAVAAQDMWNELGIQTTIKAQEWAQYLEFLGPPPNDAVDVYRLGWIYDFPDAINGLELFTCDSGNNNTAWCNEEFDALVEDARNEPDDTARYALYGQMEDLMFGEDGEVPLTPIMWYTYPNLENDKVRDTFFISPLDQIDFTKVVVQEG